MKKIKHTTGRKIMVCDLKREHAALKKRIDHVVARVLDSGWYILGNELRSFETEFARCNGVSHAIGVASGTEAIQIALTALGIGKGHEVIIPVNTAIPTAMAVVASGARPVFIDVNYDDSNIDAECIARAVTARTKAVIPVHLYGMPCRMDGILRISGRYGLKVIEDSCQAHGALYKGDRVGTIGDIGTFSFYPTKNLGCYGDGGMAVSGDKRLADKMRLLRNYGQSTRYVCEIEGINSRLDEIQAAILRVKLSRLNSFNKKRRDIARLYKKYLDGMDEVRLPLDGDKARQGVFHLYVIRCRERDGLRDFLAKRGIETQVHYPIPLHMQKAFGYLGYRKGSFPVAETLAREIVSLPIFPELKDNEVEYISSSIRKWYGYPG